MTTILGAMPPLFGGGTLLAQGEQGWTDLPVATGARLIHVDDTLGSDSNPDYGEGDPAGGSADAPYKTIQKGMTFLRAGTADRLRLKCGETWNIGTNQLTWPTSGASASEPAVLESYGTGARPKIVWPYTYNPGYVLILWKNYVAFVDVEFSLTGGYLTAGGASGIQIAGNYNLIEGCAVSAFEQGINVQGNSNNTIRRNVFSYIYGHSIITDWATANALIEDNVFYWHGEYHSTFGSPHAIYMAYQASGSGSVIVRNNIVDKMYYDAFTPRAPNLQIDDNLILRCALGIDVKWSSSPNTPENVSITNNVFVDMENPGTYSAYPATPIWVSQVAGLTVSGNVIAHAAETFQFLLYLRVYGAGDSITDVDINSNIFYNVPCGNGYRLYNGGGTLSGVTFDDNDFQQTGAYPLVEFDSSGEVDLMSSSGNRFYSTLANPFDIAGTPGDLAAYKTACNPDDTTSTFAAASYPDAANANMAGYMTSIGGTPTVDAFMTEALLQRKGNWRTAYTAAVVNDWIRARFGL